MDLDTMLYSCSTKNAFETDWKNKNQEICAQFIVQCSIPKELQNNFTELLLLLIKAYHKLNYRPQKPIELNNHDDNDCSGFDEMEALMFWEASYKADLRRAKRAVKDFWTTKIEKQPIVREDADDHNSSDCDSTCSTCEIKQHNRRILKPIVMKNEAIERFKSQLYNSAYGKKLVFDAYRFTVDQYLQIYQIGEPVRVQFIASHHKLGILRVKDMLVIYHSGQLESTPPMLCPYFIPNRLINKEIIKETADNIKILLQEDHAHITHGFLIFNNQIL